MIENFEGQWEKEWFTYKPEEWARTTHKVYADAWKAPEHARLALDVLSKEANEVVVVIDGYAAEIQLSGGDPWQEVVLQAREFQNLAGESLPSWRNIRQLKLTPAERLTPQRGDTSAPRVVGGTWRGPKPHFRNLRWTVEAPMQNE